MSDYAVGLIGTGVRGFNDDGSPRFGMNGHHAAGYAKLQNCRLAACADIKPENARVFAEHFGIPDTYTDYHAMLAEEDLDVVSVATWPHLHAEMVIACAEAGVRAVHCEKPMATTWADCKRMVQVCSERGVQLSFNHQRRFGKPFRRAKERLEGGEIGELVRVEFACSNLFDWGTHLFDMCGFFTDQEPVAWVLAGVDYQSERLVFGAHCENAATVLWQYGNGTWGRASTGFAAGANGAFLRLVGSEGEIEIEPAGEDMPTVRMRTNSEAGWQAVDCDGEGIHDPAHFERAIADVVESLQQGCEPELSARKALQTTEIIFAAYESARRRGRVELPLDIDDNPLVEMVKSGALQARPPQ